MLSPIVFLVTLAVHTLRALFRTREQLLIENLALRQQVIALKKQRPRPQLDDIDRALWVASRTAVPGRTELRSDGSAVAAENSLSTWLCLAAVICFD
jgi:hypothetical protein